MLRKPFITRALWSLLVSAATLVSPPPALAGKSSSQESSKGATVLLSDHRFLRSCFEKSLSFRKCSNSCTSSVTLLAKVSLSVPSCEAF